MPVYVDTAFYKCGNFRPIPCDDEAVAIIFMMNQCIIYFCESTREIWNELFNDCDQTTDCHNLQGFGPFEFRQSHFRCVSESLE